MELNGFNEEFVLIVSSYILSRVIIIILLTLAIINLTMIIIIIILWSVGRLKKLPGWIPLSAQDG